MPSPNPLDIPEILDCVAQFVSEESRPTCSRVSRAWYHAFSPCIWQDIKLDYDRSDLPKAVHRYSHFIRTLTIDCVPTKEYNALQCSHLRSLKVGDPRKSYDYSDFITRYPSLTRLSLTGLRSYAPSSSPSIWHKLLAFSGLTDLTVSHMVIDEDNVDSFWDLCTRLTRLEFNWISLRHLGNLLWMEFPLLTELQLWSLGIDEVPICLELMRGCPNLKAVTWYNWDSRLDAQFLDGFIQLMTENTWPDMESIFLGTFNTSNEELYWIMRSMRRITVLNIGGCPDAFRSNSLVQLRPHYRYLRELNVGSSQGVTSLMAQEILCSCPQLLRLSVPLIEARDIVEGQPWVCLGLKELSACFRFDHLMNETLQPLVLDQLSKLTQLEELSMEWLIRAGMFSGSLYQESFDLRLDNGLAKLSTLRKLRIISFNFIKQRMGQQEMDWILAHWRCLEELFGVLDAWSPVKDKVFRERLRRHGIETGPEPSPSEFIGYQTQFIMD